MMILVTGGSKSGKSKTAEDIICTSDKKRIYIATMQPYGDEGQKAIKRHREMRKEKGFETIEQYTDIENADIPEESAVLLECIGNLCANEIFSNGISDPTEKIMRGIKYLQNRSSLLVVVTNEVSSDGIEYSESTMKYMKILCEINRRIALQSDEVIETVFGRIISHKDFLMGSK